MNTAEQKTEQRPEIFDLQAIQGCWQPMNWDVASVPVTGSKHVQAYLDFYGIDFAGKMPGVKHRFGYFDEAGYRLAVHAWLPEQARGSVLLCHGYFDHVGLYSHIIGNLLEQGLAVIAYDLPGHGLSSGDKAAIEDFSSYHRIMEACLQKMGDLMPQPWHTLGQSTGGAIIMSYLLRYQQGHPFEKVVLLAPLVQPNQWWLVKIMHSVVSPFRDYVVRKFRQNSSDSRFLEFLQHHDPLQHHMVSSQWVGALKKWVRFFDSLPEQDMELVVIQGDLDDTVDWRHNLKVIQRKFLRAKIHLLQGARHQLANEGGAIRTQVDQIIRSVLAQQGDKK